MPDLRDDESIQVQGSSAKPYVLTNRGGVYSCSCPAWRNQSAAIERRTCKHLRALRGDAAEQARIGAHPQAAAAAAAASATSAAATPTSATTSSPTPADSPAPSAARPWWRQVEPIQPAPSPGSLLPGQPGPTVRAAGAAPPLLLAHVWENDSDLTGWWISEKLDGVRAYWDGGRFLSRLGNPYFAPDWFVAGLPPVPLDGELWGGRKRFQRTVSIVRRQDRGDIWREVRFVIFDAPSHDGPFEERLRFCREQLDRHRPPFASFHQQQPCLGLDHLRGELARVESLGGEGLMLRQPGSRYQVGRSSSLLKVKSFHDAEARVLSHQPGAGKHAGRLGALLVELPDGTRFSIGTGLSDRERDDPPPVGSIVTFRYQELSSGGVPRFPSYVGVRDDVSWG